MFFAPPGVVACGEGLAVLFKAGAVAAGITVESALIAA